MTPTQRHRAMASNRGRTGPERTLASALWNQGMRYYTHDGYKSVTGNKLLGSPDIIMPRKKIVIFVDGCFWHGCMTCQKHLRLTGDFWVSKIDTNRKRDQRITAELEDSGWTVYRIPEHDIRTKKALEETVPRLVSLIRSTNQ